MGGGVIHGIGFKRNYIRVITGTSAIHGPFMIKRDLKQDEPYFLTEGGQT